jgi:hypothetical protein
MRQASTQFIGLSVSLPGAAGGGAEEASLAAVADTGRLYISVEIGFEIVMRRHLMALAAFLMQPHPPALAVGLVILDPHGDDRANAGEGGGHHGNQRGRAARPRLKCRCCRAAGFPRRF